MFLKVFEGIVSNRHAGCVYSSYTEMLKEQKTNISLKTICNIGYIKNIFTTGKMFLKKHTVTDIMTFLLLQEDN